MKEIAITDIHPIRIGQVENSNAGTGCTVILNTNGMRAGLDVRGGDPALRESQLLDPLMSTEIIHSVVISGGSSFGLDAAGGVMQYLEELNIGVDYGVAKVPSVVQANIFDLAVGKSDIRPDKIMGYQAAKNAYMLNNYRDGNYGVGCGATVGKICGILRAMKSGIGSYAIQIDDLKIGAIVVVNAFGDVYDWKTGIQIAGLLNENRCSLSNTLDFIKQNASVLNLPSFGNTTIAVVITNAMFEKSKLCKIAGMAHDGIARSIYPVHTSVDGDSVFVLSVGSIKVNQDVIGTIAAEVISEAIIRSIKKSNSAYGLLSSKDIESTGVVKL